MNPIRLKEKFDLIEELWSPHIVAELNGQQVKIAKVQGEFVWHNHEKEDEMFYILEGALEMHFRDRVEHLYPGDMIVIPKGIEHKPVAKQVTRILLFEPATTINTGNLNTVFTKKELPKI